MLTQHLREMEKGVLIVRTDLGGRQRQYEGNEVETNDVACCTAT